MLQEIHCPEKFLLREHWFNSGYGLPPHPGEVEGRLSSSWYPRLHLMGAHWESSVGNSKYPKLSSVVVESLQSGSCRSWMEAHKRSHKMYRGSTFQLSSSPSAAASSALDVSE